MAYTIAKQNQGFLDQIKPLLKYLLLFVALGGIAYGVTIGMQEILETKKGSAITASVEYGKGNVFLNGESLGETPLEKVKIKPGTHLIEIKDSQNENITYSKELKFNPGIETTIFRDLGVSEMFSSGKNFWMENDKTSLTVISQPSGATVYVDGSEMGKTPLALDDLTAGNYALEVNKKGYEGQAAAIEVKNGYNLTVSAKLFPIPIPSNIEKYEESQNLYDLSITNETIGNSPQRAKAVNYWLDTRGAESGAPANLQFDYFIDVAGNAYSGNGELVSTPEGFNQLREATTGGYLGVGALGSGLSEPARETYLSLFGEQKTGTILPTGVGWLRVRNSPSLNADELTKVNVGETFQVLEISGNWVKIQITADQSGWVSGTYVEIKE